MTSGLSVLIADDDEQITQYLSRTLQGWGHRVQAVHHGQAAWDALQATPIDLAILDWGMPQVEGPDLCRRLRAQPPAHYVYIILCTGLGGRKLLDGLAAGADDFITKPIDVAELRVRVRSAERVLNLQQTLQDSNQRLEEEGARLAAVHGVMRRDLEAAARLQASMLPPPGKRIGSWSFDWVASSDHQISSVMFDFMRLDEERVGTYLLDVSGNSLISTLMAVSSHALLSRPGDVVLENLNRRFLEWEPFLTMNHATLHSGGRVCLIPAGLGGTIHLAADGVHPLPGDGYPVGLWADVQYHPIEFTMAPGDRLFFYSDGVQSSSAPPGQAWGETALAQALAETAHLDLGDQLRAVGQRIETWRRETSHAGDILVTGLSLVRPGGRAVAR